METWVKISLLLCVFGFLKEFRPSEPYVTPYLMGARMNFTEAQVSQDIYPISTYANVLSLIVVFLVTDYLRYKTVIVADAFCGLCVYLCLILFRSIFAVQVVEVFYGLFSAGEVAYYSYIYAKVDSEHFQEVSSHTRSAYLAGRAFSGIVSQTIVSLNLLSYYHLNYLTFGGLLCALIWAFTLPPVKHSIYFHQRAENPDSNVEEAVMTNGSRVSCSFAMTHLWKDFIAAFSNFYVVKWVFWWSLATCGYWQILNYIQVLWQTIHEESDNKSPLLYGLVEAIYTLLSAMASMTMGKIVVDWARFGEFVLAVCSITIGVILFVLATAKSMILAYLTYIAYTVIYNAMITVANSEVAKHINKDSYGLIFGVTTFIALMCQTVLTYVVNNVCRLSARVQFIVYSVYFGVLGVCFISSFIFNWLLRSKRPTVTDQTD